MAYWLIGYERVILARTGPLEPDTGSSTTNRPSHDMNILLLTCEGGIAGSTNSIAFLARGLAIKGHTVFVGCPQESLLASMFADSSVKVLPMTFRSKFDLQNMRQIRDAVKRYDIRIVNAQSSYDRYSSILARWFFKLPVKVVHTRRQPPKSIGGWLQNTFYVRGTDAIVTVSSSLKEVFVRHGIPGSHIKVIFNGMPPERYHQAEPERIAALRARFGIGPGDVVIGSVSRLKLQEQIVQSLVRIDASVKVLFVGTPPGCFDKLAAKLKLPHTILYAGTVAPEEALAYFRLLTIQILASITDGFGLVLLEAMGQGVPVIGTRAAGICDVIEHDVNGLLFENGDVAGLAACINLILRDERKRAALIRNGVITATERFTIQKTIDNYEFFFRELANKGS
jgi:glycosyltransferase involved in cell wall biosynthesis